MQTKVIQKQKEVKNTSYLIDDVQELQKQVQILKNETDLCEIFGNCITEKFCHTENNDPVCSTGKFN